MSILDRLESGFGNGAGEKSWQLETGLFYLDRDLGGFWSGQLVEIYGPASAGKTTFLFRLMCAVNATQKTCVFFDTESKLDVAYARSCGVDLNNVLIIQENDIAVIKEILSDLDWPDLIVFDSLTALRAGGNLIVQDPWIIRRFVEYLNGEILKTNSLIVYSSQVRMDISTHREVSAGGSKVRTSADLRLALHHASSMDDGVNALGSWTRVDIMRNTHTAHRFSFELFNARLRGFDTDINLVSYALDKGMITRSGSHYYFCNDNIGHGILTVGALISQDLNLKQKIIASLPLST